MLTLNVMELLAAHGNNTTQILRRVWVPKYHFSYVLLSIWSLDPGNWAKIQPPFA